MYECIVYIGCTLAALLIYRIICELHKKHLTYKLMRELLKELKRYNELKR